MIELPRPTAAQWIGFALMWLGGIATIRFGFGLRALEQAIPGFSELGLVSPILLLASGIACILEGLNTEEEASIVAGKLVESIRRPMSIGGQPLHVDVTASMGLAYYEGSEGSADALLERADRALYRAKEAGRNTFAATMV